MAPKKGSTAKAANHKAKIGKPKKSSKAKTKNVRRARKSDKPVTEKELNALYLVSHEPVTKKAEAEPRPRPDYTVETPRPRRYTRWLIAIVLGVLIASYVGLRLWLRQSVVPEEGELKIAGLSAAVEIRRDNLGVPYIKAQNLNDLVFAAGFAMASDRDFQIEFLRRMAYGRLAEVLGSDALAMDIYMRTLGLRELAQKNYERIPEKLRAPLRAFAAGVNARRKAFPKTQAEFLLLQLTPEEWQPQDSLALYQLFSFLLAINHIEELAFLKFAAHLGWQKAVWLFPVYNDAPLPFAEAEHLKDIDWKKISATEPVPLAALPSSESLWQALIPSLPASNNWVVAPARAKNGKSLLANDTHLQMAVPSHWYIMNLECPEYRAAGVALPGTPIVALGTNGKLAWGATMVMADNQDIFLEELRQKDGKLQYLYKGRWLDAKVTEEEIPIKGKAPYRLRRIRTRHGVLLNTALEHPFPDRQFSVNLRSDYGLAFKTSVGATETTFEGMFELAQAKTMAEARKALDKVSGIYLNMVYADEKNIGWVATGRYPVRRGVMGLFPRIGWNGEHEWDGYYARSENPSVLNPKKGYWATANHRIWDDSTELWVSASWYGSDRIERAEELLAAQKQHTREDMARIQADTLSPAARAAHKLLFEPRFHAALRNAIALLRPEDKARAEEALAILRDFDGNLGKDSAPAAVYESFVSAMAVRTFADELGGTDSALWQNFLAINKRSYNAVRDHLQAREDSPFWDNTHTPDKKESKADIFAQALADAIAECEEKMGSSRENWAWGKLHQYYWQHQFTRKLKWLSFYFNRGPHAAGGDLYTLNVAGTQWGSSHQVWLIPAMRFLVDFSAEEPAELITHMGISGNPESEHYSDMIPLFVGVNNHPLPLKPAGVEKQYTKKFLLKPQASSPSKRGDEK
ncbi:MAG: penicillin acylase family protein [Leptospiraceae bacterium]|nr:penicillin acylase family protein [Leptospiraceae bacterium]